MVSFTIYFPFTTDFGIILQHIKNKIMEQNKELLDIAEQIDYIIKRKINELVDHTYEDKFSSLIYDLESYIHEAKETKSDFESQGLTINTVEAEGYLRAMLTVQSIIEQYKN
jgi:hypothetical protein